MVISCATTETETKWCPDCKRNLPIDDFYEGNKVPRCKRCQRARKVRYRKTRKGLRATRRYEATRADSQRSYVRNYWKTERGLKTRAKQRYGLTLEQYKIALAKKTGMCDACGRAEKETKTGRLHLDHCHATKIFRGWLCGTCNVALGMCYDNPETLRSLADYIERQRSAIASSEEETERWPQIE